MFQLYKYHKLNLLEEYYEVISPHGFDMGNTGLMDSAYDCDGIREISRKFGHVPIIDRNQRRGEKLEFDPAEKTRFNERTTVERVFGRLKDEFGGRMVRVRGSTKVMAHLMFGILALTADQLLKFVQ